jgi:hypothetical protein
VGGLVQGWKGWVDGWADRWVEGEGKGECGWARGNKTEGFTKNIYDVITWEFF